MTDPNLPKSKNAILEKTIEFALDIIEFAERLRAEKHYELASQLLKAGTSVGANVHEAQSPESQADFIHKMKIADKENKETGYWLILCQRSDYLPDPGDLLEASEEISKILSKILSTSKKRFGVNR